MSDKPFKSAKRQGAKFQNIKEPDAAKLPKCFDCEVMDKQKAGDPRCTRPKKGRKIHPNLLV